MTSERSCSEKTCRCMVMVLWAQSICAERLSVTISGCVVFCHQTHKAMERASYCHILVVYRRRSKEPNCGQENCTESCYHQKCQNLHNTNNQPRQASLVAFFLNFHLQPCYNGQEMWQVESLIFNNYCLGNKPLGSVTPVLKF